MLGVVKRCWGYFCFGANLYKLARRTRMRPLFLLPFLGPGSASTVSSPAVSALGTVKALCRDLAGPFISALSGPSISHSSSSL